MSDIEDPQGSTYMDTSKEARLIDEAGNVGQILAGWTVSKVGLTFVMENNPKVKVFAPWHKVAMLAQDVSNDE